ncbi:MULTISPECIES: TetR/AcrR family transcriptional regulator [unclassified Leptolyngbya]|uniref:TetR/AcrR family transcriptional regulator n=1 Tax=unclassified Leptolyngbya TaxID=2650499 RepID=UPI001684D43C|nr:MULTISPECIES: TetR/AcrR family transcriptional regulator [unclassified Leptolyngbya]MBD1912719.1 TetR/AcrR family transcriptional regulator [Leptolyngbya sp. FACHB-8]MBD2154658.1 TetR/AcrR family transcriptional regulator [Leptolyngbya sp. FACHB-16]
MPKIIDHDQYRKELLSQCFDLFAEKGYAAITMRQIAQGLKVSTGTLYHYFPSKEVLFEQMVREMALQDIQNAIVEIQAKETTLERIEAIFYFIAKHEDYFIKQNLIWFEFYQQQKRSGGDRLSLFCQVWKEYEQEISDLVAIKDKNLLKLLGCFIDGMLLHRMFDPEEFSLEQQIQLLMNMLKLYFDQHPEQGQTR